MRPWAGAVPLSILVLSCAGPVASRAPASSLGPREPQAMEQAALKQLAETRAGRLRPCYAPLLRVDPDIERKIAIRLYVKPDGKVADMILMDARDSGEPPTPSMLNDEIARCLGVDVMTWTFPPTSWEGQVQLARPPVFFATFAADPVARAKVEKERVRVVIGSGNPEYKACYEDHLARGGPRDRSVRVRTSIRITNAGGVETAAVVEPADLEAGFRDCLVGALRKLVFGKLWGDGITIVEYPFVFTPER